MNALPMILRFCSGSVTPASRSRNSVAASAKTSGSCSRSKRLRICSASSCRITPLSTKMQVRRSPIARCISTAATVESTPPLSPQTTRPSPTCSRIRADRLLDERRHRPVAGAAADAVGEVAQDVECRGRCARPRGGTAARTAGAPGRAIAATGALALVAITSKPGGARFDEVAVAGPDPQIARQRLEQRRCPRSTPIVASPNSRCGAGATSPPSAWVISCMP